MFSKHTDTIISDLQNRVHRSGLKYTTMENSASSSKSQIEHTNPIPAITIFQEYPSQPKFTGKASDNVSVYQYIKDCEDIIRKRNLISDEDKINVLRQNVDTVDCPARDLLYSTHFLTCKDYNEFRKSLIRSFASTSKLGPISSLFKLAEILKPAVASTNIFTALKHSGSTFSSILEQFQDTDWVDNGKMDLNTVAKIISYIHFLVLLDPILLNKIQTSAPLKHNETIWSHSQQFFTFQPSTTPIRAFEIKTNSAQNNERSRSKFRNNDNNRQRSNSRNRGRSKSPNGKFCKFCKKTGHSLSECWSVKNNTFCSFHMSTTHNTKDCRSRSGQRKSGEEQRNLDNTIK